MARLNSQPSYNIITGEEEASNARQPLRETFKQSNATVASRADINNENIRAQLNTLQYELDALKQERELTELRHSQELRDAQSRAEADFKRAQAAESAAILVKNKADALAREAQEVKATSEHEKAQLEKKLRTLQDENRSLREDLDEAQTELASSARQNSHATAELEQKYQTLQASVEGLQSDLEGRVTALQSTQQKLVVKEREVGELENEVLKLKAQTGDADTLNIVKKELTEQVAYIKKLEATNREQSADIKQFRKVQKGIEVVEEEKRGLEARLRMMEDLRKELAEVQLQKRILEDEKRGWSTYLETEASSTDDMKYDTPEQMAKAFLQERIERLSLLDKLGAVQPEMAVRDDNIRALQDEKARLQTELDELRASAGSTTSTTTDNKARIRLERQKNLVTKEVEYLRAQMKTLEAEEAEFKPEQINEERSKRMHELEDLVEKYRAEWETAHAELSKVEQQPAQIVQTPRKRGREEDEETNERLGELRRKARSLQDDLDKLQTRNQYLEAELKANASQIESLKETSRTRVLEFRNNPTATAEAIKMSTLQTLRDENAALLAQLEGRPNGTKVVPISTLDNIRGQLEDVQATMAQAEKKQLRLKQIWGSKSLEFREAVCSILGWKLDFMPNGRVKATSILYPTSIHNGEEEENSIVFDGENGTMKVSGGPKSVFASEIRELIEFWVEGRKEVPCFLAACTLEFYDRSTKAQRM